MKNRRTTGRWYAAATVAIALTGIAALAILVLMPLRDRVLELNRRIICGSNLKGIATSWKIYVRDDGLAPARAIELLIERGHLSREQMICPASGLSESNYVIVPFSQNKPVDHRDVVAFEPKSNHGDGGNFVFPDGHAAFVKGDAYDQLVARAKARLLE